MQCGPVVCTRILRLGGNYLFSPFKEIKKERLLHRQGADNVIVKLTDIHTLNHKVVKAGNHSLDALNQSRQALNQSIVL